jgi:predicted acyl esterase
VKQTPSAYLLFAATGLAWAQTTYRVPTPPFPYDSVEVTYENKADGVKLAGTLTLPKSGGTFPAVLLVPGSSANILDRDYTSPTTGRKSYLALADYLTRRGIAVLRADDRGAGKSTGNKI